VQSNDVQAVWTTDLGRLWRPRGTGAGRRARGSALPVWLRRRRIDPSRDLRPSPLTSTSSTPPRGFVTHQRGDHHAGA